MKLFQRYKIYNMLKKSVPEMVCRDYKPERNYDKKTWKINESYSVCSVYDTKYNWYTLFVSDVKNNNARLATYAGFWGRKLFNHLQRNCKTK